MVKKYSEFLLGLACLFLLRAYFHWHGHQKYRYRLGKIFLESTLATSQCERSSMVLLHKLIQDLDIWTLEPLDIAVMVSHHLKLFILKATSIWEILNKWGVYKSHLPAIGVVGQPGKIDKRSKDTLLTTFLNIKCQIGVSLKSKTSFLRYLKIDVVAKNEPHAEHQLQWKR